MASRTKGIANNGQNTVLITHTLHIQCTAQTTLRKVHVLTTK